MSKTKSMDDYIRETRSYALQFEASGFKKNAEFMYDLADYLNSLPTPAVADTNVGGKWIPCGERLPEERESIFKKAKGTDKWDPEMFESISDDVNVTVEFEDGTRKTMTSYTTDGKWSCEKEYRIKMKVIAWCPLPEPYKGE